MHTNWVTRVFCYENLSLPTAAFTRLYILKSSEKMTTLSFFFTFLPFLQMWCLPLNSYSILKVCSCWWNVMFYKQYIMTSFHWKNDNIYVLFYICSLVSRSLYSLLVVIVHIHKTYHLDTGVKWAAKSTLVVWIIIGCLNQNTSQRRK